MTASVTLAFSNFITAPTVAVRCNNVLVGGKKNISANPLENGNDVAKIVTKSYDNMRYTLQGVHVLQESSTIQYKDVLAMLRTKYDGTNAPILRVTYGDSTSLVATDGSTTAIPVILESFSFPIDANDSKDGYMPVMTLNFIETD